MIIGKNLGLNNKMSSFTRSVLSLFLCLNFVNGKTVCTDQQLTEAQRAFRQGDNIRGGMSKKCYRAQIVLLYQNNFFELHNSKQLLTALIIKLSPNTGYLILKRQK